MIHNNEFDKANDLITELESEKNTSPYNEGLLIYNKGLEQLKNPALDKSISLPTAESHLQKVLSDLGSPSHQHVIMYLRLIECLIEQKKFSEVKTTIQLAQDNLQAYISSIDSDHYRNKIANSANAKLLADYAALHM